MNPRPPQPSPVGDLLTRGIDRISGLRPRAVRSLILVGMITALSADYLSGVRATMIVLYLLLGGFAAWCINERSGLIVGIVSCIGGTLIKHLQMYEAGLTMPPATEAWNAIARILSTTLLVIVASSLKSMIMLERWRAATDGLTGALNKAAFRTQMATTVAKAVAQDSIAVLCYMDLDGFKQVNDQHGHAAGDEVLRVFADGATAMIRDGDLFARIGGDEFVALLTAHSIDEGDRVAEMVHARLSRVLAATGLSVTCSMGALVGTARAMAAAGDFVALADTLMYEVKRSGKDALRVGRIEGAGGLGNLPTVPLPTMPMPTAPMPRTHRHRRAA